MTSDALPSCSQKLEHDRSFCFDSMALRKDGAGVLFLATAKFHGDLEGKTAYFKASGEIAQIVNGICKKNKIYDIISKKFDEFYNMLKEEDNGVYEIVKGDRIVDKKSFEKEQMVVGSIEQVKALKSPALFRKLNETDRFAFIAQIKDTGSFYFYEGCPNYECHQRRVNPKDDGTFYCSKCGDEDIEDPSSSVVTTVDLVHNGVCVKAQLRSDEFVGIAGVESVDALEDTDPEVVLRRITGKKYVLVVRGNILKYDEAEEIPQWDITHISPVE